MTSFIEFFKALQAKDNSHSIAYECAKNDAVVWFLLLTKHEQLSLVDEFDKCVYVDELITAATTMVNRIITPPGKKIIDHEFTDDEITLITKIVMLTQHDD